MVWEKLATDSITVAGDEITSGTITDVKNIQTMIHYINSGVVEAQFHLNNVNSGSPYAFRYSTNGTTDTLAANRNYLGFGDYSGSDDSSFGIHYFGNITTQEKLDIGFVIRNTTAGAANAPGRVEINGKDSQKTLPITQIDLDNAGVGDFAIDSNQSLLGDLFQAVPTVGGWIELGRTTLASPTDTFEVSGLADKRYYMVLADKQTSGNSDFNWRLGNGSLDTASNYATRFSLNGLTDVAPVSQTEIRGDVGGRNVPGFSLGYFANLSAKEKLNITQNVTQGTAGAANAPERFEGVGKWSNTVNPIDTIGAININAGDYGTGSQIVVLGWDPDDTHTTNFWNELYSEQLTSDNQNFSTGPLTGFKYLWLQFFQVGMTGNSTLTFNSDTTTSYARRHEINGAADATVVSQTSLVNVLTGGTGDLSTFTNMFIINNAANEKLMTFDTGFIVTSGAGTAPQRIQGVCKWDDVVNQITSVQVNETGTGFDTGSFLKIWSAD